MRTFYLWTIGCQMNQADSWRLAEELRRLGWREVDRPEEAYLAVLNTCVVRQKAEDKVIGRLGSLKSWKRRHPDRLLTVMGCFVGDIEALQQEYPYVDFFLRPSEYAPLVQHLWEMGESGPPQPEGQAPVSVFVPISYGCNHHCTYCIVRLRRGRERSRPVEEIVAEVTQLVERGAREVTLLGQNVDSYGRDLPDRPSLAHLLERLNTIKDLWRIRFLTSHPADMEDRLIEAVAELPKVCEHFELPIQAGDDQVLQRMGRGYTADQYRALVTRIRERIPEASIATDVIVGFPGEMEEQFQRTLALIEELRFDAVHVAAYSERPGTPAARLADDVPPEEKERRRRTVDTLQTRIAGEINARYLGQTVEILVEGRAKGRWKGRTRTNKLVFFSSEEPWEGRLALVRITWTGPWSMIGEVVGEGNAPE